MDREADIRLIFQLLGLVVVIDLHEKENRYYIEIPLPQITVPISYHGICHYPNGSTKQELKGTALHNWLLKKRFCVMIQVFVFFF